MLVRLFEVLDISGNGIFNSLDIILWWCYLVTAIVFYKTAIRHALGKSKKM